MVCRGSDATEGSTHQGEPLSMPSEKLLRPHVRNIEPDTIIAEVERGRGAQYPVSRKPLFISSRCVRSTLRLRTFTHATGLS